MRITFTLPRRERVQITLRGPAPSCRTAGTMQFQGVRGDNRLDFLGRIRSKAVRPGVYVLTLTSASSRLPVAKPLLVQIVSPRRTILLDDSPTPGAACDYRQLVANAPQVALLVAPFKPPAQPSSSARPDGALGARPQSPSERPNGNGVLGGGVPGLPEAPALPQQGPWALAILLMLVLFGLPLVAVSVLGMRYVRRRRLAAPGG